MKKMHLLPLLSGLMASASLTFPDLWFCVFFALVPLFWYAREASRRELFRMGVLYCTGLYVPLLAWLFRMDGLLPAGEFNRPLIALGILLAALWEGLWMGAALSGFSGLRRGRLWDGLWFALLYALGEWLQEHSVIFPFGWGKLSLAVSQFLPFAQAASVLGGIFLSFWAVWANCLLADALLSLRKLRARKIALLLPPLFYLPFLICLAPTQLHPDGGIRVSLIQASFPGKEKWSLTSQDMLEQYRRLSDSAPASDLLIWPETAIPADLSQRPELLAPLQSLAADRHTELLLGCVERENGLSYNTMNLVTPDSLSPGYRKQILVPFGETLPFENALENLFPTISGLEFFSAGTESVPLTSQSGKIGGILCYESAFSRIAREQTQNGAEVLAILSNDSWFGDSAALCQLQSNAVLRAIENRRYVLRCGNSMLTEIITPTGKILQASAPWTNAVIAGKIVLLQGTPPYTRWGDGWLMFAGILWGISYFPKTPPFYREARQRKRRRRQRKLFS